MKHQLSEEDEFDKTARRMLDQLIGVLREVARGLTPEEFCRRILALIADDETDETT